MKKRALYIIEAENGLVKIGASRDPEKRLACINLHSPTPVRLIAILPDESRKEIFWHRKFMDKRMHSEWFRNTGQVAEFVALHYGEGVKKPIPSFAELVKFSLIKEEEIYIEEILTPPDKVLPVDKPALVKLQNYMQAKDLNYTRMATKLGVSLSMVSRIMSGQRRPRMGLMHYIQAKTGNAIKVKDWL